jgi:hypothetical protein
MGVGEVAVSPEREPETLTEFETRYLRRAVDGTFAQQ